jgi:hypothetical protein
MITRNGVIYDLNKSPYFLTIDGRTFYFSSELHKKKFSMKLLENRKNINYSLTMRFNVNIEYNLLCDIILYQKIESRGFRVIEGGTELCLNRLVLDGQTAKNKN